MRSIFLNLPVRDPEASKRFFAALGFAFEPGHTDDAAACMIVERNITVMLHGEAHLRDFVAGAVGDAVRETQMLIGLSVERRQDVDHMVARALAAGARPWKPAVDHGTMYVASFQDPDGHVWEPTWIAGADP